LYDFQIAQTKEFEKNIKKLDTKIYTKIKNIVYPQLKKNPFYGTNIKKLKGDYEGVYRYRLGNYRLFYVIDNDKIIVIVTTISHRQNAYKRMQKRKPPI
jgi:mRNA interferase RelE/StbE